MEPGDEAARGALRRPTWLWLWLYLMMRSIRNPQARISRGELADELTPGLATDKQRKRLRDRLSGLLAELPDQCRMALASRKERRRMPERERKSLYPHEARDMRGPNAEDAKRWIVVYVQMLTLYQRILGSAPTDLERLLTDEVERIGRRLDYWKGVEEKSAGGPDR